MKQKTIKTDKATLLVVELPEGVKEYDHSRAGVSFPKGDGSNLFIRGNWQLLGRLPDITEEQSSKAVPTIPIQKEKTKRYITAKEALISLLEANGILFKNPVKHPKEMKMQPASFSWYKNQVKLHEEAQAKVWGIKRTYIFKIN